MSYLTVLISPLVLEMSNLPQNSRFRITRISTVGGPELQTAPATADPPAPRVGDRDHPPRVNPPASKSGTLATWFVGILVTKSGTAESRILF